jgi:hypothetical protein
MKKHCRFVVLDPICHGYVKDSNQISRLALQLLYVTVFWLHQSDDAAPTDGVAAQEKRVLAEQAFGRP